jgi:UDP-N-acetylmuramoyl-L-alanyl-D-glutamate--2,6-diaminopimelate ligase
VLLAARPHSTGRLVCVFGCGGDRDQGKRPQMGAVAAAHSDAIVLTDDNPRTEDPDRIVAEILAGIGAQQRAKVQVERDRATAIAGAVAAARAGDVVLVAGKGHEDYQIVGRAKRPYSDRATVARLTGDPLPERAEQGARA